MANKPGSGKGGRPRKPVEQLQKTGGYRKDRHGSLAAVPDVAPATPDWQDDPVKDLIANVMADGVDWLARTDEPMLGLLREGLELLERAKAAGSVRDQIAAQQNVASMLSSLGFDPTARARLGLAKVATVSKLEKLRQEAGKK